ncbi:MAG: PEP/pyruvate-binding domain-containing protein [Desulfobacterales bacterium]
MEAPSLQTNHTTDVFDLSFKVFHELMARKVSHILLVSSPYDAFIMEEEGRLAQRIIQEYRGLNLSRPPHLTWVSSAREALQELARKPFDMVITMPRIGDLPVHELGRRIKQSHRSLPVFLLTPDPNWMHLDAQCFNEDCINRIFIWSGNADLLLAIIKSVEDAMNVAHDTERARVRVIIMVEDSPLYISSLLPLLYKEIVSQTQAVMEESLNEEHRFFRMRARPKILIASTYEEALALYRTFQPYLLGVLSDVRFPRHGRIDADAGYALLRLIKSETPDVPLLNFSSEESNRRRASGIPAVFLNKNSPILHEEIRGFFQAHLGFGDFVFRMPDGHEVGRAANLRQLETILPDIPQASILYHAKRNHFSGWLMARSEILLAYRLRPVKVTDFSDTEALKHYLVDCLKERRRGRQRGVVTDFDPQNYDPEADFVKIGSGSLGGKARGLAFMASQIRTLSHLDERYPEVAIGVPKTLVISTEAFDTFIDQNQLRDMASCERDDAHVKEVFLQSHLPDEIEKAVTLFLEQAYYPVAVRSSSLLEDAQHQPFAGLYSTLILPNCHPDMEVRRRRMIRAIKLVYASTYLKRARTYARSTGHRLEQEKMAILIQKLTGAEHNGLFYPAITGQASSFNFYPVSRMKAEEGIALISLGFSSSEESQRRALRFCPAHPELLPQFSTVDDILKNAQRSFYAIDMQVARRQIDADARGILMPQEIEDCIGHPVVAAMCSTYLPEENRIRDSLSPQGYPILTFAPLLKHGVFPLAELLSDLLKACQAGMGGPVEIEFGLNLAGSAGAISEFHLLQIRPMPQFDQQIRPAVSDARKSDAICYSSMALGNGHYRDLADVVLVDPETFDPAHTVDIAAEISRLNGELQRQQKRYLLIGPGRWGSSDRWLGIPVTWKDISGVGAIIETSHPTLQADPSQGSHFFQNLTSSGICYLTLQNEAHGFLNWDWLAGQTTLKRSTYLRHIQLPRPLELYVDGRSSEGFILDPDKLSSPNDL